MRVLLAAVILCLGAAGTASAQIMEMNGTWVLNGDKSIGPHPESETIVYKIKPGEQGYTMDSVSANGNKGHNEWAIKYDGMEHPTATPDGRSTVMIRKMDSHTEFVVNKRDGKITETYTRVLTDDGKTIMSVGRNAEGKVAWVRVFEKQ